MDAKLKNRLVGLSLMWLPVLFLITWASSYGLDLGLINIVGGIVFTVGSVLLFSGE